MTKGRFHMSPPDNGPKTATWVVLVVLAVMAVCLYGCGCASNRPTSRYPVPHMLDPVTGETPNVQVR
jgi:hypothetical protein